MPSCKRLLPKKITFALAFFANRGDARNDWGVAPQRTTNNEQLKSILEKLAQHIEGLVFAADAPISAAEIRQCLAETFETEFSEADVAEAIGQIKSRYGAEDFAIELVEIAGGLQFMTKGAYHATIATWLKQTTKKRLSQAALETLAIIAYKQPVTKTDLEAIRGVSCDYSLQKLLEKELVSITGRSDGPGRPLLYGTSIKFMDYFGLKSLDDLPKPKDFKDPDSEIGERAPIEETVESTDGGQGVTG